MPWDPTPWFPGIVGARVSPEIARLVANMAAGDTEGVGGPDDLKVVPTGVLSASVNVMPGSVAVANRNAAADGAKQTYVGRLPTLDNVGVPGGASASSSLIVVSVEDPQYSRWSQPPDPATAQYIFTRRIPNVNPSVRTAAEAGLDYAAYAIARIDMPAGQGTVAAGYITDLRELATPFRAEDQLVSTQPPGTEGLSASTFARWITPADFNVRVPKKATHFIARLDVLNSIHQGPNVFGTLGLRYNGTLVASNPYAVAGAAGTSARVAIQSAITNGAVALAPSDAGQIRKFDLIARRDGGTGFLEADLQTRVSLNITWLQRPR